MSRGARLPLFDRISLALLLVFLFSDVMGGAIRYAAVRLHFVWLPYLPHILIALALIPLFFAYVCSEGVTPTYLIVSALFAMAAIFGALNLGNADQVEFGLWALMPFLFGVVALPSALRGWRKLKPYAVFLWTLAVGGVLINYFYSWPWIGLEYQVGATTATASRSWSIHQFNLIRLPGFSEASFFVAPQILFLALFLRETLRSKWRIPMWILSGIAVGLTTSKTPIVIFLLLSVIWIFSRGSIRPSWRLIPVVAACLDIAFPFSMMMIKIDWLASLSSPLWQVLVATFVSRMQRGWPEWIRMVLAHGNVLLGRGLGGIGTAQLHFEPALFSPSDNMAVYIYATFGVFGLLALLFFGWRASRAHPDTPMMRFFFFSACTVLLFGMTLSVMDASFLGLMLGAAFRFFQEVEEVPRSHSPALRRRANVTSGAEIPRSAPIARMPHRA